MSWCRCLTEDGCPSVSEQLLKAKIICFSANRMAPYPNRYWCIYYQLLLLEIGIDFLPSVKKNFSKGTIRNCYNRKVQELIFRTTAEINLKCIFGD